MNDGLLAKLTFVYDFERLSVGRSCYLVVEPTKNFPSLQFK